MTDKPKDTADYEAAEQTAIEAGKASLARLPWLFNRAVSKKGFFAELRKNNPVHPDWYSVHCVDGVGTKLFFAPWSGDYSSQMIDGVAMNANDLATLINAYPSEINIYLACQTQVEEQHMGDITKGIGLALERIKVPNAPFDVNIGKLETASLDEMISLGVRNKGFDVGIVMTGYIEKEKVPNLKPHPGDKIIGVSSTGLHSNGFTSARHQIFTADVEYRDEWRSQYHGTHEFDDKPKILEGETVLQAMIAPTALYLREAIEIGQEFDDPNIYGVNITGNGLYNFNRAGENVDFHITNPLKPLPVHNFLVSESGWGIEKAYTKQNMGMGFAYVVPAKIADSVVGFINQRKEYKAQEVGEVAKAKKSDTELTTILHLNGEQIPFTGYAA